MRYEPKLRPGQFVSDDPSGVAIGDAVEIYTGDGPTMIVANGGTIGMQICYWFDDTNQLRSGAFPSRDLVYVQAGAHWRRDQNESA